MRLNVCYRACTARAFERLLVRFLVWYVRGEYSCEFLVTSDGAGAFGLMCI